MSQRSAYFPVFVTTLFVACTPATQPVQDVQTVDVVSPADRVEQDLGAVRDAPSVDVFQNDLVTVDLVQRDTQNTDTVTTDQVRVDTVSTDAVSTDVVTVSVCGTEAPASGSPCAREGVVCEYGVDPRPSCRTQATCTAGQWLIYSPRCVPLPEVTCPPTREQASGQSCDPMDAICSYEGLHCTCTNCTALPLPQCSGPITWHCEAPHSDPACPAAMPLLGLVCPLEDQVCNYGCEAGTGRTCVQGLWQASDPPGGCPVSTRRAKHDIVYLSDSEADAVADETLAMRLATYAYNDPALQGRRHLGIILEDQRPGSPSVDPERNQVALYGMTSQLLATVQAQARRIDALEREVRALRQTRRARP